MSAAVRPALAVALALIASLGAASAQGQSRDRDEDYRRADASAVVAAELAFARAAQEKGQWTAFAEFAAEDAVMFVPEPVNARAWLKGRANPPQAVRWQPHQVWSSCDGSLAVTKGAWQRPDGSVGYFTTVWQRQGNRRKVEYRWVLDQGDTLAEPLAAPDMIGAKTAVCPARLRNEPAAASLPQCTAQGCSGGGRSNDGTLEYRYDTQPNGARTLRVSLMTGEAMEEVLRSDVAAPSGG
jgi:hypothetical protein